jgi:hypothetical protein
MNFDLLNFRSSIFQACGINSVKYMSPNQTLPQLRISTNLKLWPLYQTNLKKRKEKDLKQIVCQSTALREQKLARTQEHENTHTRSMERTFYDGNIRKKMDDKNANN